MVRPDHVRLTRRGLAATSALLTSRRFSLAAMARSSDAAWSAAPELPIARSEFGAAVIRDAILVAGGFDAGREVDVFAASAGEWAELPNFNLSLHHPGVAALNGRLVVAGGYDADRQTALAGVWLLDVAAGEWTRLADLPRAKGAFGMVEWKGTLLA